MIDGLKIEKLSRSQCCDLYEQVLKDNDTETLRWLCLNDLFFLLTVGCRREDANRDWIYDRCREVEAEPDGCLDLWFREGYKSTVITFALTIQEIFKNRDITVGIFSHTRPIAKAFLAQIKREFESNTFLKGLFPDVLYAEPAKESPKWSLDDGIIVCRRSNPKESTIEAWGLVDGMPTSKHYQLMIYDDVVVPGSVTTPEMIQKTTDAWALSLNLGAEGGRVRYIGTRYHSNDTYSTILERGSAKERRHPATDDGTFEGKPVLWDRETFEKKVRDMGSFVAASQLLQNPLADKASGFSVDWVEYYDILRGNKGWNYYLMCDPATEKKKDSDYTVMLVIATAPDGNYYLVDGFRDRLNLTERTLRLMMLHRKWKPVKVGYEKYGMQSDIEHIKYVQQQEGYRFIITELKGSMPKNDRIRRLIPLFENRRFYLPRRLAYVTALGKVNDLIADFISEEYMTFPVGKHDDMFDCMSRICDEDMRVKFPKVTEKVALGLPVRDNEEYDPLKIGNKRPSVNRRMSEDTMTLDEFLCKK